MSDYYYLHENVTISYSLSITPSPPADQAYVNVHQGGQDGPIKETQQLDPNGSGTLTLDLDNYSVNDSPLFLEFIAVKEDQQTQTWQAASLADATPATINVPATASVGDQVTLQVASWMASYYDSPGGTPSGNGQETDITRIPDADKQQVSWRVNGVVLPTQGDTVTLTIDASQASQSLPVEAYIGTPTGVAVGTIVVGAGDNTVVLLLGIDPMTLLRAKDVFTLSADDNSITQTKTVATDNVDPDPSDGKIEFHFTGLDPSKTYTLTITEPDGDPHTLFTGVAYNDLSTAGLTPWGSGTSGSGGDSGTSGSGGDSGTSGSGGDSGTSGSGGSDSGTSGSS